MRQQVELQVTGMDCAGCAQRAEVAVTRVDGVVSAQADHAAGRVCVVYDPARARQVQIADRLAAAGFAPTGPETDEVGTGERR